MARTIGQRMKWFNMIAFQTTWWTCVLGASYVGTWGGLMGGIAGIGLMLVSISPLPGQRAYEGQLEGKCEGELEREIVFALMLGCMGWTLDTFWVSVGLLSFHPFTLPVAPPWIACLWIAVGLSAHHSLAFLKARPVLAGVLAAVAAPISYLTAERFGAVIIGSRIGLTGIALTWALGFATLFRYAETHKERNYEQPN